MRSNSVALQTSFVICTQIETGRYKVHKSEREKWKDSNRVTFNLYCEKVHVAPKRRCFDCSKKESR